MKLSFLFLQIGLPNNTLVQAQEIYSKAYGNPKDPAIPYIHGGPRGNATLFEGRTATFSNYFFQSSPINCHINL